MIPQTSSGTPVAASPTLRHALLLGAALLAGAGCGNGSSSSGNNPNPPGDVTAPQARLQFPPTSTLTDSAQTNAVVAATDDTGVAAIEVNGRAAQLGADGLWRVAVPLDAGSTILTVLTRDTLGNSNALADAVTIERQDNLWIDPGALAFDVVANEALALDGPGRALYGVELLNGVRTLRSGRGVGNGPSFQAPRDVAYFGGRHSALVTDGVLDAVLLVDLGTGLRSTFSSGSVGTGPVPLDLFGITVDDGRNRALAVDAVRAELVAIDLVTGNRTTISNDTVGSGPSLLGGDGVALDLVRNRALIGLPASASVVAVNLGNGDRTVFSGAATGGGPAFVTPLGLVVDPFLDRLLVTDPGARSVFAVQLGTGALSTLSSASFPPFSDMPSPSGIALHLGNAPLISDVTTDAMLAVGSTNGFRSRISGYSFGSNFLSPLDRPSAIAILPPAYLVAEATALSTITVPNGGRTILSLASFVGSGPAFVRLVDVDVRSNSFGCIAVLDAGASAVLTVTRVNGNRQVVSGPAVGSGPQLDGARKLALEPAPASSSCLGTALVISKAAGSTGAVLRVDLETGARTLLSDDTHGAGPLLDDPVAIELDENGTAYVLDAQDGTVVTVDPLTGNRFEVFTFAPLAGKPSALGLDLEHGRLLVTTRAPAALLAGDFIGGGTTRISDAQLGTGPELGDPVALVLEPSRSLTEVESTPLATVIDAARASLTAVETRAGTRVLRWK